MSDALEKMLENLTPAQAARLMLTVSQIDRAARAAFGCDVPMESIASLIQVRDSVFHGELDEMDMSNALYNLRQIPAVREQIAQTEGLAEAKMAGADPKAETLDAETLMGIKNHSLRMNLARKHGIGVPEQADRGQRRPAGEHRIADYEVSQSQNEAIARLNAARGLK